MRRACEVRPRPRYERIRYKYPGLDPGGEAKQMAEFEYDLFTIGAGSGGVRGSRASARYGARVAVAECSDLGGTCVNLGCIPKKLLVYASHFPEEVEDMAGYGWTTSPLRFDWRTLLANKDREIARLNGVYGRLLEQAGVALFHERARILDPHTVQVGERRVTARYILVATGSWPCIPDVPGRELGITSNEAFHLPELPERVLIVGGGYIAVEFAGILHGLGSRVVQIHRGPLFLRGFDDDVRAHLADEMTRKGVELRFNARVEKLERGPGGIAAALSDGSVVEVDQVLFATGREPRSRDLGLEQAGVRLEENGAIAVDAYSRTSVPSIFAIGDVTDRVTLTPVALAEGEALARTLFRDEPTRPDHLDVPSAVFSQPPIGSCGLTESQAREVHGEVDIYRSKFRGLKHTLSGRSEQTLMKLVVARASQRVVGLHMVGPEAGEIVQGFAVAIKMGATKAQFDATIGIHPTAAEEFVTMREPVKQSA
jgi:glutathione reductase (NADPH)